MKKLLTILILLIAITAVATDKETKSYIGIDVRSYLERQYNPAPGSIAITNSDLAQEIGKHVKKKGVKIKVFCESGMRASKSKQILNELGYTNVENISSWRDWNKLKK